MRNVGHLLGASESPDALSIAEDRIRIRPKGATGTRRSARPLTGGWECKRRRRPRAANNGGDDACLKSSGCLTVESGDEGNFTSGQNITLRSPPTCKRRMGRASESRSALMRCLLCYCSGIHPRSALPSFGRRMSRMRSSLYGQQGHPDALHVHSSCRQRCPYAPLHRDTRLLSELRQIRPFAQAQLLSMWQRNAPYPARANRRHRRRAVRR
jgi:hypothetical protein